MIVSPFASYDSVMDLKRVIGYFFIYFKNNFLLILLFGFKSKLLVQGSSVKGPRPEFVCLPISVGGKCLHAHKRDPLKARSPLLCPTYAKYTWEGFVGGGPQRVPCCA